MMRCNTIVLSDGHVYQLIETVGANKIKMPFELGVKTTMKTILLLDISVCMMTRILAQVIEDMYVLKHSAGSEMNRVPERATRLPVSS